MTFLANILTKDDKNNSFTDVSGSKSGTSTDTTGYNSLIINVITTSDSDPGGLKINFSSTGTNFSSATVFFTDTVFGDSSGSPVTFIKTYPILKQYYKIDYTPSSTSTYTITARLSTQSYSNDQNSISAFDNNIENTIDAFGKLRVSYPQTLLDLRVPGQVANGIGTTGSTGYVTNDLQFCYNFGGTAGSTGYKLCNNSQIDIFVNGEGTFINQSRKYCTYQPGKSLLIMMSGIMDSANALGVTSSGNSTGSKSRLGYYDDYNGLYYEYVSSGGNTGSCSINIKQKQIVSPISQSSWNIDKMDGKGISGLKLDWTKAQLFVIDLEWLGVGRVRFGFYAYGKIQYCHVQTNINSISLGPYTYNINLPIRCELIGTTASAKASMIQICSTVVSEGGYTPIGRPFSQGITGYQLSSTNNIIYLRGGNTAGNYYHQQILPTDITFASSSVGDVGILTLKIYLPPVVTSGITWSDVNTNFSVCQYAQGSTSTSISSPTGITLYQSAISGRGSINFGNLAQTFNDIMQITSDVTNQSAVLAITVDGNFGGSSTGYCTITWVEIY